jgi:hypothetical protein
LAKGCVFVGADEFEFEGEKGWGSRVVGCHGVCVRDYAVECVFVEWKMLMEDKARRRWDHLVLYRFAMCLVSAFRHCLELLSFKMS